MTLSGNLFISFCHCYYVLIPLLVDDPLWAELAEVESAKAILVLIPLLVDDPLWVIFAAIFAGIVYVLIPLLVDDPLWVLSWKLHLKFLNRLNPSFSGWPSLGTNLWLVSCQWYVLIPLLVDDPLWAIVEIRLNLSSEVLIPLLVDDPLWAKKVTQITFRTGLNPSFSGWPSLGHQRWPTFRKCKVLIPLLVDDPLWAKKVTQITFRTGLNPSFSGWPSLGLRTMKVGDRVSVGLNPSFSGWPSLGLTN